MSNAESVWFIVARGGGVWRERVTSALPARTGVSVSDTPHLKLQIWPPQVYSESTTHFHRNSVWDDDFCLADEESRRFGGDEHL